MYVIPNSRVEYFGDLGLSPDHSDSVYFPSTSAKDSAFSALTTKLLAYENSVTYINKDGVHVIRSGLPVSTLHKCSYLRFRNASFENKWFYAFVTEVNYINNGLTEVVFTIDSLMTWMGSFSLGECLVVREHTATDGYGEHRLDEGLPLGVYKIFNKEDVYTGSEDRQLLVSTSSVVIHGESQSYVENAEPTLYDGFMISGGKYLAYDLTESGLASFKRDMDTLVENNKVDAIISMHIAPRNMVPVVAQDQSAAVPRYAFTSTISSLYFDKIDGYSFRNKKLLSYPYCLFTAVNGEGSANEYMYEFFTNDDGSAPHLPRFNWRGICFDVPEAALIPGWYKGKFADNIEEALIMHQFPQASLPVDQFKAWVAQINSSGWVGILGSIAQLGVGLATGGMGLATAGVSGANTALGLLQEGLKYASMPPSIQGTANTQIMEAAGLHNFTLYHKTITAEYAKMIDDYFTAYGYRVNAIKTPSLANRPAFTYVQTSGANVHGDLPASDGAEIESILNNGCRFWRSFANIGNLHIDNSPVTGG